MTSDTTLETTIATLPTPENATQPFHHVSNNVYISRSIEGATQLILEDATPPSQALDLKNGTLQIDVHFDAADTDSLQRCLVLEFGTGIDAHAIAKVAEHLTRGNDDFSKTGEDLRHSLEVFRDLVEGETFGWGFMRIVSLWGEFASLERLLSYADTPLKQLRCVQAWQAFRIHCLDFSLPNQPTSFEVKTTAQRTRSHEISSVDQLTQAHAPCIFLASWMIRPVGPEEGWSVMDIVNRIHANLTGDAATLFQESLDVLELDEFACSNDHFIERNNRPLRLYPAQDVPGVNEFTPLPEGVPSLTWPVNLTEQGLAGDELDTLFTNLLAVYDEVNQDGE